MNRLGKIRNTNSSERVSAGHSNYFHMAVLLLFRCRIVNLIIPSVFLSLSLSPVYAADFTITSEAELITAINSINGVMDASNTINFSNDISLTGALPNFNPGNGNSITFEGNNHSLSGNSIDITFDSGKSVEFKDLTLSAVGEITIFAPTASITAPSFSTVNGDVTITAGDTININSSIGTAVGNVSLTSTGSGNISLGNSTITVGGTITGAALTISTSSIALTGTNSGDLGITNIGTVGTITCCQGIGFISAVISDSSSGTITLDTTQLVSLITLTDFAFTPVVISLNSIDHDLKFDQGGVISTLSIDLSGVGSIRVANSDKLTLTGSSTYTGGTTVDSGTLIVNGSIIGTTTVLGGGCIGGTGIFGDLVFQQGTLAPGNSIGTITLNGDLSLNASSTYEVELNAAGETDLTIVNGSVDLTESTLSILAEDGTYQQKTEYLIIDNDGADAVIGEFGNIEIDLLFLSPFVSVLGGSGNDVILTLFRNDIPFVSAANTQNQQAVAAALDLQKTAQTPNFNSLINSLVMLDSSQAASAFDSLSGEIHGSVNQGIQSANRSIVSLLSDRLHDFHSGELSTVLSAHNTQPLQIAAAGEIDGRYLQDTDSNIDKNYHAWINALGGFGDIDTDNNAAEIDYRYYGLIAGTEFILTENILLGASFSFLDNKTTIDQRSDEVNIDSYMGNIYAGWKSNNIYLHGLFGFSFDNYDTSRQLTVGTQVDSIIAEYSGNQIFAYVETGTDLEYFGVSANPYIALEYLEISHDDFIETGSSLPGLSVFDENHDVFTSHLGLRLNRIFLNGDTKFIPELNIGWNHIWTPTKDKFTAQISGSTNKFIISGVETSRDSLDLGARLAIVANVNLVGFLEYNGNYNGDQQSHTFMGGFRSSW